MYRLFFQFMLMKSAKCSPSSKEGSKMDKKMDKGRKEMTPEKKEYKKPK